MDDIGSCCCAQPNTTLSTRKSSWVQNSKTYCTFALVVHTTCTNKLNFVISYKSLCTWCSGRWLPTYYVWWIANQMAWMTSYVFERWMMSLNVHFKSQSGMYFQLLRIMLLIPLSMLVGINHLVSQPCIWEILYLLSYLLVLQVVTLGSWNNCFIQSSIQEVFVMASLSICFFY